MSLCISGYSRGLDLFVFHVEEKLLLLFFGKFLASKLAYIRSHTSLVMSTLVILLVDIRFLFSIQVILFFIIQSYVLLQDIRISVFI